MLITSSDKCPYSKYIPIETVFADYVPNVSAWNQPTMLEPYQVIQNLLQELVNSAQQDGGSAIIGLKIQFFSTFTSSNCANTQSAIAYGTSIKKP